MINNLQDLQNLVNDLVAEFDGCDLTEIKISLSDRFNEFKLFKEHTISDDVITLQCEQIGNVFKGTHRVLGKD